MRDRGVIGAFGHVIADDGGHFTHVELLLLGVLKHLQGEFHAFSIEAESVEGAGREGAESGLRVTIPSSLLRFDVAVMTRMPSRR